MQTVALLSGEHPELPFDELTAIADAAGLDAPERVGDRVAVVPGRLDCRRPSMTTLLFDLAYRGPVKDAEIDPPDGSYGVRCHAAGERDQDAIERRIGDLLSAPGNTVDLDAPDTWYDCVVIDEELLVGPRRCTVDRGVFDRRRSHLRPYSSPVTLHPRIARAMVNLTGCPAGARIVDPFCGTGGILLEAGLIGMELAGSDLSEEMIAGAEQNLAAEGLSAELHQCPVAKAADRIGRADAVVADIPYGRSSHASTEPRQLLEQLFRFHQSVCDGRLVVMTDIAEIEGREPDHELYVHRSLTRRLYVLEPDAVAGMI